MNFEKRIKDGMRFENKAQRSGVEFTRIADTMFKITITINGWTVGCYYANELVETENTVSMYFHGAYLGYISKFMVGIE